MTIITNSLNISIRLLALSQIITLLHGFVTIQKPQNFIKAQCNTQKYLLEPSYYSSLISSDKLIATIDSDIASISDDNFKTVFLGGIVVMFGGLISTFIVGTILKMNNGYGRVIAESYPETSEEEFINGLPEEEREEARELLRKIREQKNEGKKDSDVKVVEEVSVKQESEKDVFSDY